MAAGPTAMDEESRKGQFGWFEVTHVSQLIYILINLAGAGGADALHSEERHQIHPHQGGQGGDGDGDDVAVGDLLAQVVERSIFGELLGEIPKECVECCRSEIIAIISSSFMLIIRLEAVTITDSEVKLINEIVMKHSNGMFGKEVYNQRDKMVKCDEFEKFVRFLLFCRKTVVVGEAPKSRSGWPE